MPRTRLFAWAAASMFCLALPAIADTSITFAASGWNAEPSGFVNYENGALNASNVNVNGDLGLQRSWAPVLSIDVRQPVPFLPDVKLGYADLDFDGSQTLSHSIVFGSTEYLAQGQVDSRMQFVQKRALFYYNPLDNVVNLRIGLDVRYMKLKVRLHGVGVITAPNGLSGAVDRTDTAQGHTILPLAYLGMTVHIPETGFAVGSNLSYLGYGGNKFYDVDVVFSWHADNGLGIRFGYRHERLKLVTHRLNTQGQLTFKGVFVGGFYRF